MKRQQHGFTLIEIAIVLVIIGLILGGILKGQELIDSAKVRKLTSEVTGIRAGWYGFQDRFNALPGDFNRATTLIGGSTNNGNANGRVDTAGEAGGVWEHLADAGFITGEYGGGDVSLTGVDCSSDLCPSNPYNGFYKIAHGSQTVGLTATAHELSTGASIPITIIIELDIKLDDGFADQGDIRAHSGRSGCVSATTGDWDINSTSSSDCAAAIRGFQ